MLDEEFIKWLDEWEQEVEQQADSSATETKMMLLSKETRTGIRMTGMYIFVHSQQNWFLQIYHSVSLLLPSQVICPTCAILVHSTWGEEFLE